MSTPRGRRARLPAAADRLALHRPAAVADPWSGPCDGDPVRLPALCARLRAGSLCECGFGFDFDPLSAADRDVARLEAREDGVPPRYQEEDRVGDRVGPGGARAAGRGAARRTVVERFGIGIAPAVEDRPSQLAAPDLGWNEPPF